MKLNEYYIKAAAFKVNRGMKNFVLSKDKFETPSKEYYKIKFEYHEMEIWFDFMVDKVEDLKIETLIEQMTKKVDRLDHLMKTPVNSTHTSFIGAMLTHKYSGEKRLNEIMKETEEYVESLKGEYNFRDLYIKSIEEITQRFKIKEEKDNYDRRSNIS